MGWDDQATPVRGPRPGRRLTGPGAWSRAPAVRLVAPRPSGDRPPPPLAPFGWGRGAGPEPSRAPSPQARPPGKKGQTFDL